MTPSRRARQQVKSPTEELLDWIDQRASRSYETYRKMLVTLAGGALGLTIVFVKELIGPSNVDSVWLLQGVWALWIVVISLVLLSFFSEHQYLEHANSEVRNNQGSDWSQKWLSVMFYASFVAGMLFIIGLVAVVFFVIINTDYTSATLNIIDGQGVRNEDPNRRLEESGMGLESLFGLVGVVIGGMLTIVTTIVIDRRRAKIEARQLANAIAGEVFGLKSIVEKREYVSEIRKLVDVMKNTGKVVTFKVGIDREYFNIYQANAGKIGSLKGSLPRQIAMFYTQGNAILDDLRRCYLGEWDTLDLPELISQYETLADLFEDAVRIAGEIVGTLEREYG